LCDCAGKQSKFRICNVNKCSNLTCKVETGTLRTVNFDGSNVTIEIVKQSCINKCNYKFKIKKKLFKLKYWKEIYVQK